METSCKLVLLGESSVGKSSLVIRLCKSQFHEFQEATIGAAFLTQTVTTKDPERIVKFEIWDTAGQERYRSLIPMYYRGANAAVIVYDITSQSSLEVAQKWVAELKKSDAPSVIALVGNKEDLGDRRAVASQDVKKYADENGLIFTETSAKTGKNVRELYETIAHSLPAHIPKNVGHRLTAPDALNPNASSCCR